MMKMNDSTNFLMATEKMLIEGDDYTLYKKLENFYKYLFEKYLLAKIDLKKYDQLIENSGLYFGKSKVASEILPSGLKDYLNLDYLFVLNNFFIEKLGREDIVLLEKYADIDNCDLNDELYSLIDRTYKEVIKNNYFKGTYTDEKYQVCYGFAIPSNFVDNDALVFKIYYSKNTVELGDEDFIKNITSKRNYLLDLSIKLKDEIKEQLNINCNVSYEKIPK